MAAGTAVGVMVILVFAVGVGGGLLLYALVRREHDDRRELSRAEAERVARLDTRASANDRTERRDDRSRGWGEGGSTAWNGRPDDRDDRDDRNDDRSVGWDDRSDDRRRR